MLPNLTHAIIAVISRLGYGGVLLLMAIESACIPLPSEITLPFAGYLVATGRFRLAGVALAGALGCNLGSLAAYAVGFYGGRPLAERYSRRLLLPAHELDRAEAWFLRYGDAAVLVARMLPAVRTFIALPAGVARMPQWRFHLWTFLGSLAWCWLLAWAGERLGANWDALGPYFHRFDAVWAPLLLATTALLVWRHVHAWRKPQPQQEQA